MSKSLRVPAMHPVDVEPPAAHHRGARFWLVASAIEAVVAAIAIVWDLLIPSLALLAMAAVSLALRRQGFGSLGLRRFSCWSLVGKVLLLAVAWSVFQLAVTMPIANHVSGQKQDLSGFEDLQGNLGLLVVLLVISWLLGGFGEELAYRGYLFTRVREAISCARLGLVLAVATSSLLFGLAHAEQGLIGVLVVTIDGIYFSVVRLHFETLWASVLAHGFNNTIGFIAFFMVGPVYGLW